MKQERSANFSKKILVLYAIVFVAVVTKLLVPSRAVAQSSPPVTTTVSLPFSGTLKTDLEDISISGTVQLRTQVVLSQTTVFAEVGSSISQTTGIGLTSGQTFVGAGGPVQMCKIPAGPRGSAPVPLDVNPHYRLIPTGPLSPFYARGAPKGSLPLLIHVSFRGDGTLVGASVVLGQ